MVKKILLAIAIALPLFGASAQSTVKIGLVDTSAIIQALPDTQEAQKKVADASKKYEDEYARLGEEMKRMYDELQNMKEDELPAIRERKIREFQDYQNKVQTFEQTAQQDLQRMQQELMAPIFQKIKAAVESVGKENNFSMIQDNNPQMTFYFADPVVDITPMVKAKLGLK